MTRGEGGLLGRGGGRTVWLAALLAGCGCQDWCKETEGRSGLRCGARAVSPMTLDPLSVQALEVDQKMGVVQELQCE